MKVYVIEKGVYSDRHIIGVVESEEEAKNIVEAIKCGDYKDDSISYEEYDTRQFSDKRLRYTVSRYSDGDWNVEYDDYDLYKEYEENACVFSDYYVVYANSPGQAIKIVQDMRAEELAREKGLV